MAKNSINEIAALVARKQKIGKKEAADIVTAFFNTIADGLRDDRLVKVRGLGTFKVTAVKARESVNVNTGERVVIEGHDKVSFVPDQSMKDLVNKPFAQFTTVVVNDGVNFDSVDAAAAAEESKMGVQEDNETDTDEDTEVDDEQLENEQPDSEQPSEEAPDDKNQNVDEQQESPVEEQPIISSVVLSEPAESETEPVKSEPEPVKSEPESVKTEHEPAKTEPESVKTESEPVIQSKIPEPRHLAEPTEKVETSIPSHTTESLDSRGSESHQPDVDDSTEDNVSREYFDEQMATCRRRCNRNLILSLVFLVVGLVAGFLVGRYVGNTDEVVATKPSVDTTKVAKAAKPDTKPVATPVVKDTVPQSVDTVKTMAKEEEKVEKEEEKPAEVEEDDVDADIKKLNSDRRLRFGAYEITGIDKVIKLKKGQTMKSYSNKTLGKDMVVYFQVLNGVEDMKAGETLKVPKIRLKKKFRKNK